jgi:hypothetical protein
MKATREKMMEILMTKYKFRHVRTSEEFYGEEQGSCIWMSAENGEKFYGKTIFDYWTTDYKHYDIGVLKKFEEQIQKLGWYCEWYDCGTMMICEL